MPKIIENLDIKLADEARKQIEESGYAATTIRSVAKACGVGVGTVYNYYPSKDAMVAHFMLADWQKCMDVISKASASFQAPEPVVRCIFEQFKSYADAHNMLFDDKDAISGFVGSFGKYHALLRTQLSIPLRRFCGSDFEAEFISESIITWVMAGSDFDKIYNVIKKLF